MSFLRAYMRRLDTTVVAVADGHVKCSYLDKFYYTDTPWLNPATSSN